MQYWFYLNSYTDGKLILQLEIACVFQTETGSWGENAGPESEDTMILSLFGLKNSLTDRLLSSTSELHWALETQ